MFLDSMTIWYVIPKVSGYHRIIYGMFLAIILYLVIIPKVSAFCSIGVDKTESFGIINRDGNIPKQPSEKQSMKTILKLLSNQRSLTTLMHTDHRELSGSEAEIICGG